MADATKKNQSYDEYYNYLKKGYSESNAVKKSQQALNGLKKPDAYQSKHRDAIENYTDKYLNSRFDYNFNNDPSYQRYKQQYTENAQRAMKDTVGQVSALTGGFGNSYAQTAGQTAYNEYMDKLNNVIDSLEQKAYNRYLDKNSQIYNGIGLMQNIENTDYNRYRDAMNDYYANRDYYTNQYNNERNFDYGKYNDMLGAYWNNVNYQNTDYWNTVGQENADRDYAFQQQQFAYQKQQDAYQKQQDAIANKLAQDQFNYNKTHDEAVNYYNQQKDAQKAQEKNIKEYTDWIDDYKKSENPTDKNLARYIDSLDLDVDTKEKILKKYGLTTVWLNIHGKTDPNPNAKNTFNWPNE